jgi:hypothetical protein
MFSVLLWRFLFAILHIFGKTTHYDIRPRRFTKQNETVGDKSWTFFAENRGFQL